MRCRICHTERLSEVVSLGTVPLSNSFLQADALSRPESTYPLVVYLCVECRLAQTPDVCAGEEIFSRYPYFSSISRTWVSHTERFAEKVCREIALTETDLVLEIASNDGCLLRHFLDRGIRILGVEPAENVARAAIADGIPTRIEFFSPAVAGALAAEEGRARLIVANNVLGHVPEPLELLRGLKALLAPGGIGTLEFPHLLRLLRETQFDTIYHEHLSYFSFFAVERLLAGAGLTCYDVEELSTHGGSLRVYVRHAEESARAVRPSVADLRRREGDAELDALPTYQRFRERLAAVKRDLVAFLEDVRSSSGTIVGYGAPAKGNTLLNYCGIGPDLLPFTVDMSRSKQGLFLPGSHIPVHPVDRLQAAKPDFVLILPWNIKDEIMAQLSYVHDWNGRFVIPIPALQVSP